MPRFASKRHPTASHGAIFANSYKLSHGVVCAQSPKSKTLIPFLSLIWDKKIKVIVVLNQFEREDAPRYWPDEAMMKAAAAFGEMVGITKAPYVIERKVVVAQQQKKKPWNSFAIEISKQGNVA